MTYRVCNTQCPAACSFATVTFNVGGLPDCIIPTIITPNADGFNDVFTIPALCTIGEGAADLEVTIFNQWGDLVYHEKPYLNDWGGTYNNEDLPAGTYFFVVKLNEVDKPLTGFLLIQR
jgi:gliding motility-associated-like protein